MFVKLLNAGPPRVFAVVLATGEEVVDCLSQFARAQQLDASQVTAIGAFHRAVVGFYDLQQREYLRIEIDERVELLSMLGDVAQKDGESTPHLHVVLGRRDGSVRGGHLLRGEVEPTCEIIVTESPGHLRRRFDPATGLALLGIGGDAVP